MLLETENGYLIKKKGVGAHRPCKLIVTDKGIFILDYGLGFWMLTLSTQFGLIGGLIYAYFFHRKKKKMVELFKQTTPKAVVEEDKNSYFFEFPKIEKFKVSEGRFSGWRGNKMLRVWYDGIEFQLFFPKDNYDFVVNLLRQKTGGQEKK